MNDSGMVIAAKCAPEERILADIEKAGLNAVELYTNARWLKQLSQVIRLCQKFPFQYAIHAPNDSFLPDELAGLSAALQAKIVVFHNIFWEDEWKTINDSFRGHSAKLCLENVATIHEPLKFMRRFNMGCCLDLEHLQMEVGGVYEEEFIRVMESASHVHMTGYSFGTQLWHTPVHHAPEHCTNLLNLFKMANYSGMVVSEARVDYQNYKTFNDLLKFFREWTEV